MKRPWHCKRCGAMHPYGTLVIHSAEEKSLVTSSRLATESAKRIAAWAQQKLQRT